MDDMVGECSGTACAVLVLVLVLAVLVVLVVVTSWLWWFNRRLTDGSPSFVHRAAHPLSHLTLLLAYNHDSTFTLSYTSQSRIWLRMRSAAL